LVSKKMGNDFGKALQESVVDEPQDQALVEVY
jgi:hypothetical protein